MNKHCFSIITLASLLLAFGGTNVRAQFDETNSLFYHAQRAPQSNLLNPAFHPNRNTFYMILPGADIQFGSPLAVSDLIYYDKTREVSVINLDTIFHRLSEDNQFRFGANVQLFGFGFKIKHLYLNANLRMVNQFSIGLPISTVNALLQGNVGEDGKIIPDLELLNGDIFNAQSYIETSIGGAFHIDKLNLTIGAHAKLLGGIVSAQTDRTRIAFETDPTLDAVTARMYYELQAAGAVHYDTVNGFDFKNKSVSDIIMGVFDNRGLAFDLGVRWDLGPFSFSLAINDLSSGIHWNKNVYTVVPKYGQGAIEFNGVDINNMLDQGTFSMDSIENYLQERLDGMTPRTVADSGDYWTAVPTKLNLGANITLLKYLRAGLLFHGQIDRGIFTRANAASAAGIVSEVANTFRWNLTASFSANLFNWAELIVGSSIVYDGQNVDFFNPGAGLLLTPGTCFQTYVMADYVSSIYLTDSKAFNLKLGLNLLFGKGGKKKPLFDPIGTILTPNEQ